jgi:hypothetical protein
MAKWDVEIIFEPTGDYMNFEYETDQDAEDLIFDEILASISIVPELIEENDE